MHSFFQPQAVHILREFRKNINQAELNAVGRATYFVFEPRIEWGDNIAVASIEDAEDAGHFCVHVGLPERPDMRSVFAFLELVDAVRVLSALKIEYPDVPQWFSGLDFQTEMKGSDVWAGLVAARASSDQTDADCPWVQLAADFDGGKVTRRIYGDDHRKHWLHAVIATQIEKPTTLASYRDQSGN